MHDKNDKKKGDLKGWASGFKCGQAFAMKLEQSLVVPIRKVDGERSAALSLVGLNYQGPLSAAAYLSRYMHLGK